MISRQSIFVLLFCAALFLPNRHWCLKGSQRCLLGFSSAHGPLPPPLYDRSKSEEERRSLRGTLTILTFTHEAKRKAPHRALTCDGGAEFEIASLIMTNAILMTSFPHSLYIQTARTRPNAVLFWASRQRVPLVRNACLGCIATLRSLPRCSSR